MRLLPAEAVLNALTNGKMQAQAALLSQAERRAVAEFASGKRLGYPIRDAAESGKPCLHPVPMADPTSVPGWSGWGNGITNTRFQSETGGGISATDLPRLKLKWVFGYANVSSARAQPAIAGGRLFVASENGLVHALDPTSGCMYWSFRARSGVVSALTVGKYRTASGGSYAVYFGDRSANAYAVNAETGTGIWARKVDTHPFASITGSPAVYAGRVFVPVAGLGEEAEGGNPDYSCCTFRGSVSALDANTGALLWKTYTVRPSRPRGRTAGGIEVYGPAGGGVWSTPTVDAKRKLVYVATGNGYADPPQATTDAVMALDLASGRVRWVKQTVVRDVYVYRPGCGNDSRGRTCGDAGPDYDFSASPALVQANGRQLLVLPQKSGVAYALDPANQGRIVWQYRFGQGSRAGGQWGCAVDADRVYFGVRDVLTDMPGGMHAVRLADGRRIWRTGPQPALCAGAPDCTAAQGAAVTAIPGAVLSGALDGGLRAYSSRDGAVLWTYDTNREFTTINGVKAHGGAMDGAGPVVAGRMMYVNSGSSGPGAQAGNALLAFGID